MPLAEITVDEAYPVYNIQTKDNHWATEEHYDQIEWIDVPQELIDEHNASLERYLKSQRAIREFRDAQFWKEENVGNTEKS